MELPRAGAAPSTLLQGGGTGPLQGPALLPWRVKALAPAAPLCCLMFLGNCSQWWVWPLVTASYSEKKFLMGMMWMDQFSAQLLQFIQGDKPVLKKEAMRHGSDVSSF